MLDSVVAIKNHSSLQVIIVNDGSTDNTQDIILYYKQRYPNLIDVVETSNGGSGAGRNLAFKRATGKYLGLLDADDHVITDGLDAFIEFLICTDVDAVFNSFYKYYCPENQMKYNRHVEKYGSTGDIYTLENSMPRFVRNNRQEMQGTIYRTEIIKNNGFELTEGVSYVDAEYITIPYKWIRTYVCVDIPYYVYNIGVPGQSIEFNNSIKKNSQRGFIIERMLSEYDDTVWVFKNNKERMECNIACVYMDYIINYLYMCDIKYMDTVRDSISRMKKHYPYIYSKTSVGGRMKSVNYFGRVGYLICIILGTLNKLIERVG